MSLMHARLVLYEACLYSAETAWAQAVLPWSIWASVAAACVSTGLMVQAPLKGPMPAGCLFLR